MRLATRALQQAAGDPVTPRQALALSRPLNEATVRAGTLGPYTATRSHATGLLIMTILAVDR